MTAGIKFIFMLASICYSTTAFAQKTEVHAKLIIQDARFNNADISEAWVQQGGYLVLYSTDDSEKVFLASVNPGQKSQSYGNTFDLKVKSVKADSDQYEHDIFTFKWSYINDYDDKKGTASVKLTKIVKDVGVAFTCLIIAGNLDVIEFKGYVQGSLKPLK